MRPRYLVDRHGLLGARAIPIPSNERFQMEDLIETAIDKILISAGGDMRQALRAVLLENIKLKTELSRRESVLRTPRSKDVLY